MNIQLMDIWTAAGVLLGFQVTALIWRIDREVQIKGYYLTPSDYVNIISIIASVIGVFVLPTLGFANSTFLKDAFGLAALLFMGHAFARAGHYNLYGHTLYKLRNLGKTKVPDFNPPKRTYFPRQERVVVAIIQR